MSVPAETLNIEEINIKDSDIKYAVLCETNGEEMEQWYSFIKYNGNETALTYLNDQLNKVDIGNDDFSVEFRSYHLLRVSCHHTFSWCKVDRIVNKRSHD